MRLLPFSQRLECGLYAAQLCNPRNSSPSITCGGARLLMRNITHMVPFAERRVGAGRGRGAAGDPSIHRVLLTWSPAAEKSGPRWPAGVGQLAAASTSAAAAAAAITCACWWRSCRRVHSSVAYSSVWTVQWVRAVECIASNVRLSVVLKEGRLLCSADDDCFRSRVDGKPSARAVQSRERLAQSRRHLRRLREYVTSFCWQLTSLM